MIVRDFQIELGSTATAYEPYCGGIPAPNPSYPIMPVCNDGAFMSFGRNLIDKATMTPHYISGDLTIVDADARNLLSGYIKVEPNTQYRYRIGGYVKDITEWTGYVFYQDSDGTVSNESPKRKTDTRISFVIMTPSDCHFIRIGSRFLQQESAWVHFGVDGSDGGQAIAPELWAIPGTDIRDEWDCQTGKLTRRIWDEIVLDGSELWGTYQYNNWKGFVLPNALPEIMYLQACISNYFGAQKKGFSGSSGHGNVIWCGVDSDRLYVINPGEFYDESLRDYGVANWKAHLAEHPLRIWVARNNPLITYTTPQKITQPPGYGQIVQQSGSVSDCPIAAKYLTHAGGAK